jgi:hypothetical protein
MATSDSDQYAAMVAGVEEIVTIVAPYSQIEALYLANVTVQTEMVFSETHENFQLAYLHGVVIS